MAEIFAAGMLRSQPWKFRHSCRNSVHFLQLPKSEVNASGKGVVSDFNSRGLFGVFVLLFAENQSP